MSGKKTLVLCIAAVFVGAVLWFSAPLGAVSLKNLSKEIRICVKDKQDSIQLEFNGPSTAFTPDGKVLVWRKNYPTACNIRSAPGGMFLNDVFLESKDFMISMPKGTKAKFKGKYWDGKLLIRKSAKNKFTLINVIPVEEYVEGVVEHEMAVTWPIEALKAQAIASRTYSVFRMLVAADKPFDIMANVQNYAIPSKRHRNLTQAVEETSGVVMIYKGRLFPSFFHAMCGGVTDYAGNNWMYPFKFPESVKYCKFCSENVDSVTWSVTYDAVDIERRLRGAGFKVETIIDIIPYKVSTVSERITEFRIDNKLGTLFVRTNELRKALGFDRLKSNYFKVRKKGTRYVFIGLGRGHGAGLCQVGAKRMAQDGDSFEAILKYYYPGIEFRRIHW